MPPEWQEFTDKTVGMSETGIRGQAQGGDALQEQVCRRLTRMITKGATFVSWLFVSARYDLMRAISCCANAFWGRPEPQNAPRVRVDISKASCRWRARIRQSRFLAPCAAGAPPRPLASLSGVALAPGAVNVFHAGDAAFTSLYTAVVNNTVPTWTAPPRVHVDAALVAKMAAKAAEKARKRAERLQKSREQLADELDAADEEREAQRGRQQGGADGGAESSDEEEEGEAEEAFDCHEDSDSD
jgi:hypothetical protein